MKNPMSGPRGEASTHKDSPESGQVTIGRIIKAFGLQGQLLVEPLTDFPERFAPESIVLLQGSPRTIQHSRLTKGWWVLKLEGINTLEEACQLRDEPLTIGEADLHPLPQGQYYRFQIVGLRVYTTAGEYLGDITDILETGSNDVYVVKGAGKETLVPAIAEFIHEVDLEGRRIVIEMEGASST